MPSFTETTSSRTVNPFGPGLISDIVSALLVADVDTVFVGINRLAESGHDPRSIAGYLAGGLKKAQGTSSSHIELAQAGLAEVDSRLALERMCTKLLSLSATQMCKVCSSGACCKRHHEPKSMGDYPGSPPHTWPFIPEGWTWEEMCEWAVEHDSHGHLDKTPAFTRGNMVAAGHKLGVVLWVNGDGVRILWNDGGEGVFTHDEYRYLRLVE